MILKEENPISFEDLLLFLDNFSSSKRKTLGKILKMLAKRGVDISRFNLNDEVKKKRIEDLERDELKEILG